MRAVKPSREVSSVTVLFVIFRDLEALQVTIVKIHLLISFSLLVCPNLLYTFQK